MLNFIIFTSHFEIYVADFHLNTIQNGAAHLTHNNAVSHSCVQGLEGRPRFLKPSLLLLLPRLEGTVDILYDHLESHVEIKSWKI